MKIAHTTLYQDVKRRCKARGVKFEPYRRALHALARRRPSRDFFVLWEYGLLEGFYWDGSPQGFDFWNAIAYKVAQRRENGWMQA